MYTYEYAYTYIYMCTYMYLYKYMYICIYIYIWGLWAIASANVTAWSSADNLLRLGAAYALLLQEHHIADEAACRRAELAPTYRRWKLSLQAACSTDAVGSSAVMAVAVARHTGLARSLDLPSGEAAAHSVQVRHWYGVCKGGVHLVSVYLYDGEGLSRRNFDLLQELAHMLKQLRGLWICGRNFDLSPE